MTTRALLIRHGETIWNASGRWQGNAPVPLSTTGQQQARALGRYLANDGPPVDVLYSSPLKRAYQTAEAIAHALDLPVHTDARLRETDLGDWQGLTREEAAAWDPERFAAFSADWYTVAPPNGESRNQLKARARAAFEDITARHPGQQIALVSHGGTLNMLIESLFGQIKRPSLTNTSITIIEQARPGAPWQAVRFAWSPHLADAPLGETW
ncbi:MAG: histidine phosphatase family protein [Anaerolineae bacterium]|jgi:probable phosphoglycerate mutase|nr:histidine phosphatase family protein [Anaerolineae bacterium]